ncbi:DUF2092 domain-containing protein [Paraburkholderia terrae]|nr:DUF2092 domain-containing protein [Paraburkholderia terrae]
MLLTTAPHAYSASEQKEPPVRAARAEPETASQAQARAMLMKMAEFLGGTPSFRVGVRSGYDAVQPSGQKIEFGEYRTVTLSRPDRMRVESERSDGAKTLVVLTGKEIVLVDLASKVYATAPQPGMLDESIVYFVKDLGMRLPLAALLLNGLPEELQARVRSVDYVEKTSIYGTASYHLAARTDTVDFQVWIADGDKPLLQRIVLTYKNAVGQPQFWAEFVDWNLAPQLDDATFSTQIPDGLQKVAFAAQLPRASPMARQSSAKKGAK